MEGIGQSHNRLENTKELEDALWARAEEFSTVRQALEAKAKELEEIFEHEPIESLNLHETQVRAEEEREYWETKSEINKIKEEENKLEQALVDLGAGVANIEEIKYLIPVQDEEENKLSKRKRAILEEKKRLGIDPRQIMSEMYGEFGTEKMRLTTGRHVKTVKNLGTVDPLFAASEFYYRTTDSHGGKVDYGKRSASYVSKSGKRIRKK